MIKNIPIVLLLFFAFSFLFVSDHSFDQDLGRHIKTGEIIVNFGQVPKVNLFSYTNPNFPFINTHWLFGALVYYLQSILGVQPLLVIKIIIILLSLWITLKLIPKEHSLLLLPIGFIFFHVLRERVEFRPEIFSFLFTALTLYILERFSRSLLFLLPVIQLVWTNTHIYFFVGLLLQAIFLLDLIFQNLRLHLKGAKVKILSMAFVLSVLASLINPNGISGFLYPLNVTENYGYTIVENQTLFLLENINFRNPNFIFVKISAGIIILSLIFSLLRKNFNIKNWLLALTGLGLALMHVRSFPYLVFLALPATLANFGPMKPSRVTYLISLIISIILLYESSLYLNGSYYKTNDVDRKPTLTLSEHGKGALDFVTKNNLPQPIFNNFDIGSYIIYRGYPHYKVFIDGRPEAYPADFFTNTYMPAQSNFDNFKKLEENLKFQTIIFSHTDQTPWGKNFLKEIIKYKEWKLVYLDDFMVVLCRADHPLPEVDLAKLTPDTFRFETHVSYLRVAFFLIEAGQQQAALPFVQKALQLAPNSTLANLLLGNYKQDNNRLWW